MEQPVKEVTECVSSLQIVDEKIPADFNTSEDHSPQKMIGRPGSFLDGFPDDNEVKDLKDSAMIVDAVPADLNTEDKVEDQIQYHLQDTNGPFPGLTMAYDGNQSNNFKSKKGFEPLCNSTLVLLKTSTGSEKTCQNLETRKHPMLKPLNHYILNGWTCDQRQLPQDQGSYWNFRKGLYVDQDI